MSFRTLCSLHYHCLTLGTNVQITTLLGFSSGGCRPVFFDPSGLRAYIVSAIYWTILFLVCVVITCLLASSIAGPSLPSLHLSDPRRDVLAKLGPAPFSANEPVLDPAHARAATDSAAIAATRYGYLVNWDDNSFSSLKRNASSLDVAIVEWLHAIGPSGTLTRSDPGRKHWCANGCGPIHRR